MDLFKALLAATSSNDQVVVIANLLVCLLAFFWIFSSRNAAIDSKRWKVWSIFWLAYGLYYASKLIQWSNEFWWIPYLFLDVSVLCLFWGGASDLGLTSRNYLIGIALVVLASRIVDVIHVRNDPTSLAYFHQVLACLSLLIWSWIHRIENASQSLVIMVYGLIQLPTKQLFALAGIEMTISSDEFVNMSFLAYFLGKFALIPATISLLTEKINISNEFKTEPT